MACNIENKNGILTKEEVKAEIFHKKTMIEPQENQTAEISRNFLTSIRTVISKVKVPLETLPQKVIGTLVAEHGDLIERYGVDGKLAFSSRITDKAGSLFKRVHGLAKAKVINNTADNIIKANMGTKIHTAMEGIMELLINLDKSGLVIKNLTDSNYGVTIQSFEAIRKELDLAPVYFNRLVEFQNNKLEELKKIQMSIDPNGQMSILTEQFVYDEIKDIGGTADVVIIFSDNSYGQLDYKTISPKVKSVETIASGERQIIDANWIPFYKHESFNAQLPTTNKILENKFGLGVNRFTRVIPIHIELVYDKSKPDGQKLKEKLTQVSLGVNSTTGGNKFLSEIAIQETTGLGALDKAIKKLDDIKNNLQIKLDNSSDHTKRTEIAQEIARKRRMINKMILDRDITLMRYDVDIIVKRYLDNFDIADINNPEINGEPNPTYLSTSELSDFIMELRTYQDILKSSPHIMKETGIKDKAQLNAYSDKVKILQADLNLLLDELHEQYISRALPESYRAATKDMKNPGFIDKLFTVLSEQDNIIFRRFNELLQSANNKRRIASQKMLHDIKKVTVKVEQWAKNNDKSVSEAFDMLYNSATGNLYSKHSSKFYEDLRTAQSNSDIAWLKENIKVKDDYKELYKVNKENFLKTNPDENELKFWEQQHNFKNIVLDSKMWRIYYEIKPNLSNLVYYSEGFNIINQKGNEALLEYWNFWEEKMLEASQLLGLKNDDRLPPNFLPWIRGEFVENLFQNGWNIDNIRESTEAMLGVQDDDVGYGDTFIVGKVDPRTGKEVLSVPRYFMNPLKDNSGRLRYDLKSRDLSKSLYVFYDMALNYNYMNNEVEPYVEALKDVIIREQGISEVKEKQTKGGFISKIFDTDTDALKLFDTMTKMHLYGINIVDADKKTTKFIKNLKTYQTYKEIAFAPMTWSGDFLQARANTWFQSLSSYFYTQEHLKKAVKMRMGRYGKDAKNLHRSLVYFFEPNITAVQVNKKELKSRGILKVIDSDTAFWGFRYTEELNSADILVSLLQNYAFDSEGNMTRLKNLPEGTKSLLDSSRIENDELIIDGIRDANGEVNIDKYTALRNLAMGAIKQVRGQASKENMYAAQGMIAMDIILHFKSWLPGMIKARAGEIEYNSDTNSIIEGKYKTFFSDLDRGDKKVIAYIGTEMLPRMAKFIALTPFIAFNKNQTLYKINEVRARELFKKYKDDHRNDPAVQKMNFNDFVDYRQGQLRSLAAELMVIMAFITTLMLLGLDWDENGEPDYKQTWAGRTIFRILNRGRREIAFFINPNDWWSFLRTPIPTTGIIMDAMTWFNNTRDESGDLLFGEDERTGFNKVIFGGNKNKDKKPVFYETLQWLPGNKALRMLELFENDEQLKI